MVDKTAETPVVSPPASATTTIEIAKTPEVVAVAPVAETPVAVAPAAETPAVVAPAATPTPPAVEPAKVEPAPAATPVVVAEAKAPSQIIIQPGNNLWKLSRKIYGKGTMYTVIYEANKDQIRKPGLIYPGQVFLTPDAAKTP